MTDPRPLVDRLRSVEKSFYDHQCNYCDGCHALRSEAADEIDSLTRERDELLLQVDALGSAYEALIGG